MAISKGSKASALSKCQAFCDRLNAGQRLTQIPTGVSPTGEVRLLYYDDETPLYEVALNSSDGNPGYVIISLSPFLPQIVEYSFGASSLVGKVLEVFSARLNVRSTTLRVYYFSACEIFVRYTTRSFKLGELPQASPRSVILARFPDFREAYVFADEPEVVWVNKDREYRESMLQRQRSQTSVLAQSVLQRAPVSYNQNYSAYDGMGNAAPGSCIAGCVPVAWAMLESAYAAGARLQPGTPFDRIYQNVPDWQLGWSSWMTPNPSRSTAVESRIWTYHAVMHTSCDGATSTSRDWPPDQNFLHNPARNFQAHWGVAVIFRQYGNSYTNALSAFHKGHPVTIGGVGKFTLLAKQLNALASVRSPRPGEIAHCVLGYGWDDTNRKVIIEMGWGTLIPSRWIDLSLIRGTKIIGAAR